MTTDAATATAQAPKGKGKTTKYRLVGTNVTIGGKVVPIGSHIELTDAEAKSVGKKYLKPASFKWPPKKKASAGPKRLTNNLLPPPEPFDVDNGLEDEEDELEEAV